MTASRRVGVNRLAAVALLVPAVAIGADTRTGPQDLYDAAPTLDAEAFPGTVTLVLDGDSLFIKGSAQGVLVHIDGVDAPELYQAFGSESRALIERLTHGRTATVSLKAKADNGELFARVELDGADLGAALVRAGMAYYCRRTDDDRRLAEAEREAREAMRGIWSVAGVVPPWRYRGSPICWQEDKGP